MAAAFCRNRWSKGAVRREPETPIAQPESGRGLAVMRTCVDNVILDSSLRHSANSSMTCGFPGLRVTGNGVVADVVAGVVADLVGVTGVAGPTGGRGRRARRRRGG
jgi:hypothetical protein